MTIVNGVVVNILFGNKIKIIINLLRNYDLKMEARTKAYDVGNQRLIHQDTPTPLKIEMSVY